MAPFSAPRTAPSSASSIDALFTDAFAKESLLLDIRRPSLALSAAKTLAAAALVRGDVAISDVSRNLARLTPALDMAHWNECGFKIGLCRVSPASQPHALLALVNSTAFGAVLDEQRRRFDRLYTRRAHVHHYTQFIELEQMEHARANVVDLIGEYAAVQSAPPPARVELPLDRAIALR